MTQYSTKNLFILLTVCICLLIIFTTRIHKHLDLLQYYGNWIPEYAMPKLRNYTKHLSNQRDAKDTLINSNISTDRNDHGENSEDSLSFPVSVDISLARHQVKNIWDNPDAKYIVYSCTGICGGWGDRMAGIASTFMWSLVTNRKFVIQQTHPCALTKVYKPNHVNWSNVIPKGLSQTQYYLIDNADFSQKEIGTPNTHIEKRYTTDKVIFRANLDWIKGFNNALYKDRLTELGFSSSNLTMHLVFPKLHNILFRLQQNLNSQLNNFIFSAKVNYNTSLVCAQIRLGKNPTIPNDPTRNKPETVSVIWDFLAQYNNSAKHRIFVTTDSEEVRQTAKKLFPTNIIDTSGKITHLDRSNPDQACEGMQKVALDFNILSHCDVLVISRSNFGEYAAYLRNSAKELYGFINGNIVKGFPKGSGNK